MNRRAFLASSLAFVVSEAFGQDDNPRADYPPVIAGYPMRFPRDDGSHPAYRTEWWYITGWVSDANGGEYGVQITFFRNRPRVAEGNPSQFAPRQLLFAHAALADRRHGRLRCDQRAARAGFGLADAAEATTDVKIGDWSLELVDGAYVARIDARDFVFDLRLVSTEAVLLEGERGFSRKGRELRQASYYYSRPQLTVSGSVVVDGRTLSVRGNAWLDHEWSSEILAKQAVGWDWTGINLDDGGALMAFRMRDRGGNPVWAGGTYRAADGRTQTFAPDQVSFAAQRRWRSARTQVEYPVAMVVTVDGVDYALEPLLDDQELDSRASTGTLYWEGAVRAMRSGREIGRGYLELTGYAKPVEF